MHFPSSYNKLRVSIGKTFYGKAIDYVIEAQAGEHVYILEHQRVVDMFCILCLHVWCQFCDSNTSLGQC